MEMNRRSFIAATAATAVAPNLIGCTVTAAEVAADGQALSTALNLVANLYAVTNPTLAAELRTAASAVLAATANWQTGSSTAAINSAFQAALAVLATIDPNSQPAQLAAIAVAAFELILSQLPKPPATLTAKAAKPNPYSGKAKIPHVFLRSKKDDFVAAWNKAAKSDPTLASAVIK